jgi:hypothetical protein
MLSSQCNSKEKPENSKPTIFFNICNLKSINVIKINIALI